jgi:type IV pilus assembly protein PilV
MTRPLRQQQGSMMLEALIAILIFSMGILAIVGMQAVSIKNTTDAKYRTDASLLANQLIGQMWADDKATAALQASYNSASGAKYLAWKASVEASLPGAAANPPTVVVGANNVVTITVQWQSPGETTPHNYVAVAQING